MNTRLFYGLVLWLSCVSSAVSSATSDKFDADDHLHRFFLTVNQRIDNPNITAPLESLQLLIQEAYDNVTMECDGTVTPLELSLARQELGGTRVLETKAEQDAKSVEYSHTVVLRRLNPGGIPSMDRSPLFDYVGEDSYEERRQLSSSSYLKQPIGLLQQNKPKRKSRELTTSCTTPSFSNFLSVLQDLSSSSGSTKSISVSDMVPTKELTSCSQTVGKDTIDLSSIVVSVKAFTRWDRLSEEAIAAELLIVEQDALAAYQDANYWNPSLCDPQRREVTSVTAELLSATRVTRREFDLILLLKFQGLCTNCNGGSTLLLEPDPNKSSYDIPGVTTRRSLSKESEYEELEEERSLEATREASLLVYPVDCLCPFANDVELRAPFPEEFQEFLVWTPSLNFGNAILVQEGSSLKLPVQEVKTVKCTGPDSEVSFSETVTLSLDADCQLTVDDLPDLAADFMGFYNWYSETYFCDPFFTTLTSSNVLRVGAYNEDLGSVTVELALTGTCLGCDPESVSIYDTSFLSNQNRRELFEDDLDPLVMAQHPWKQDENTRKLQGEGDVGADPETCFCNPESIIDGRSTTEVEFIRAFTTYVDYAENLPTCASSIGFCGDETKFQSYILVTFNGNATEFEASGKQQELETSAMASLSSFFQVSNEKCNPELRRIDTVSSTINVVLNVEFEEGRSDSRRLLLDDVHSDRFLLELNETFDEDFNETATLSPGPTPRPTLRRTPRPTPAPTPQPTPSPTRSVVVPVFEVLLSVSGVCIGCRNELFNFYDDVVDGNFRKLAGPADSASPSSVSETNALSDSFSRMLESAEATSACYCPLDSQINTGGVFEEQAEADFVGYLGDQFPEMANYEEVRVTRCSRQKEIPTRLRLDVKGFLTSGDIPKLERVIKETYNNLASQQFCDTSFRRIKSVSVKSFVYRTDVLVGGVRCPTYAIDFNVEVNCRQCQDYDSLFFDGFDGFTGGFGGGRGNRGGRRELQHRFLQSGAGNCYCEPGLPNRRPMEEEFFDALNEAIQDNNFRGLCGLKGYVDNKGFHLSSMFDVDPEPSMLHKDPPTKDTWKDKIPFGARLGGGKL